MDFNEVNQQLTHRTPQAFLDLMQEQTQEDNPYFIFDSAIDQTFEINVQYLESPETLTTAELTALKRDGFLVVCQTIDGDFIGGTLEETLIIPQSLYKSDIESYPHFLSDFFAQYEQGLITSPLLPKVTTEE